MMRKRERKVVMVVMVAYVHQDSPQGVGGGCAPSRAGHLGAPTSTIHIGRQRMYVWSVLSWRRPVEQALLTTQYRVFFFARLSSTHFERTSSLLHPHASRCTYIRSTWAGES